MVVELWRKRILICIASFFFPFVSGVVFCVRMFLVFLRVGCKMEMR